MAITMANVTMKNNGKSFVNIKIYCTKCNEKIQNGEQDGLLRCLKCGGQSFTDVKPGG